MSELIKRGKFLAGLGRGRNDTKDGAVHRVAIVDGAIGGPERVLSLAALFPNVQFQSIGHNWPEQTPQACDVLIVPLSAGLRGDLDTAFARLVATAKDTQIVVVLQDADVISTRRLIRHGAADVLPAPVSELALTLCLERLFEGRGSTGRSNGSGNEVVAFLKAGGGVGATSLLAQLGAIMAAKGAKVGAIDLDIQFGNLGLYLDLADAISIADLLASGNPLDQTPFATALSKHRSGMQVLGSPRDLRPLETLTAADIDSLIAGLSQSFELSLIDLPSVWTAWTNRVLQLCDRIVLVTHLSVPHVNLVKRQLQVLATQGLDNRPLILACNALAADQQETLPLKVAERALGRTFDVVLPQDNRTMNAAINQGVELSTVRRGTKLEKALAQMAGLVQTSAPVEFQSKR